MIKFTSSPLALWFFIHMRGEPENEASFSTWLHSGDHVTIIITRDLRSKSSLWNPVVVSRSFWNHFHSAQPYHVAGYKSGISCKSSLTKARSLYFYKIFLFGLHVFTCLIVWRFQSRFTYKYCVCVEAEEKYFVCSWVIWHQLLSYWYIRLCVTSASLAILDTQNFHQKL